MIPYFEIPSIPIVGEYAIQPFGLLVVIAIFVGQWVTRVRAKEVGISDDEIVTALMWVVGGGFVGAHLVQIIFYEPGRIISEGPLVLLKFWDGISSLGGFFGAFAGLAIFYGRINKRDSWLPPADSICQGLAAGWIFGRLGCTVAHDHPGAKTDFFLAVVYPDGPRHDLGFYEFLYTALVIFPATLILHRFNPPRGAYVVLCLMLYTPIRFVMDFLRASGLESADARYLGLTPAQYGCIILFGLGIYFTVRLWRSPATDGAGQAQSPANESGEPSARPKKPRTRKKKRNKKAKTR